MNKLRNQNIIDFVINSYGTLEQLGNFFADNSFDELQDYYDTSSFFVLSAIPNDNLDYIKLYNLKIVTGEPYTYLPDFDNSFNEDFAI